MTERLEQAFASGRLLHPVADVPNFLHLVRAVGLHAGGIDDDGSPRVRELAELIGHCDHLILVLVDGMGMYTLQRRPGSFLRKHLKMEMRAVFPATTACAITALCTGLWPGEHGLPGWWAYLHEREISCTCLPFIERFSGQPLTRWNVRRETLWPHDAMMKRMRREPIAIVPEKICDTVYSRYFRGERRGFGYRNIAEAVDAAIAHVRENPGPTYAYVYFPEFDTSCHHHGTEGSVPAKVLERIEQQLERLCKELHGRARVVIVADHGLLDVAQEDHLMLTHDDPLLERLIVPPTGEPRVPIFHVKPGRQGEFEEGFRRRFGEAFELLPTPTAVEMRLFGEGTFSEQARRRFGDYLGIALAPTTLHYFPAGTPSKAGYIGYHAGPSPQEMRVPLIVV